MPRGCAGSQCQAHVWCDCGHGYSMGPWSATDPRQHRDWDSERERRPRDSPGSWPETDEAGSLELPPWGLRDGETQRKEGRGHGQGGAQKGGGQSLCWSIPSPTPQVSWSNPEFWWLNPLWKKILTEVFITDLQCCVSFWWTAKWFGIHRYKDIYIFFFIFFPSWFNMRYWTQFPELCSKRCCW